MRHKTVSMRKTKNLRHNLTIVKAENRTDV